MSFSSTDSIKRQLAHKKKREPTNSGVYLIGCKKADCEQIYVGESHDIPHRLQQHEDAKTKPSGIYYTSAKHKGGGHELDTSKELVAYKSNSKPHRLNIETCLITVCNTVRGNKASTSTRDMKTLAPKILNGAPINWKIISTVQPTCLSDEIIPKSAKKFFRESEDLPSENVTAMAPPIPEDGNPQLIAPTYQLRSRAIPR